MSDVQITITLPETLAREANALGLLSSEHIQQLLRAEIRMHLAEMANDPDIQGEIAAIDSEFRQTESDGLTDV